MVTTALYLLMAFQGAEALSAADIIWLQMPTGQEVSRIIPDTTARPWAGVFEIHCTIQPNGKLADCTAPDAPARAPAAEWCEKIGRYFRAAPRTRSGLLTVGRTVRIPIRFQSTD